MRRPWLKPLSQRLGLHELCLLLVLTSLGWLSPSRSFQVSQKSGFLTKNPHWLKPSWLPRVTPTAGERRLQSRVSRSGCAADSAESSWKSLNSSALYCLASAQSPTISRDTENLTPPLWEKVFHHKFLFTDSLPSVIPPLHAALFAKANLAARAAGVFSRGAPALCAALAAASLAAIGSWRLLGAASRSLRGLTAQHRAAEARAYGPLHSLDATLKPLHAQNAEDFSADSTNGPGSSGSSSSASSNILSGSNSCNTACKHGQHNKRGFATSNAGLVAGEARRVASSVTNPKEAKSSSGTDSSSFESSKNKKDKASRKGRKASKTKDGPSTLRAGKTLRAGNQSDENDTENALTTSREKL